MRGVEAARRLNKAARQERSADLLEIGQEDLQRPVNSATLCANTRAVRARKLVPMVTVWSGLMPRYRFHFRTRDRVLRMRVLISS